ncbi:hypothetical protein ACFRFL_13925 [Streptomyces sp. NPDC056708]|uniref:hypothetical protein n=1 Tax=unclassified Streptomyces TaxID=2593676 RepID=UPI0036A4A6CD
MVNSRPPAARPAAADTDTRRARLLTPACDQDRGENPFGWSELPPLRLDAPASLPW